MHKFLLGLIFILGIVGGCTPGTQALPIEVPYGALESAAEEALSDELFESTEWVPDDWWTIFSDDQLTEFIHLALEQNPTLQAAQAKILQATATADRARSTLFPILSWAGDIAREKLSKTGIIPFGTPPAGTTVGAGTIGAPITPGPSSGIPVYFTQYETELNLSYDFDIWGKNRNTFAAAIGEVKASIADEAFSRLQLAISVAQTYFQLQIDYKRQEIARAIVENQTKYQELIKQRLSGNLDTAPTLNSAQTNVSGAKLTLLQVQGDIAVNEYKLKAYLAGNFEEEIFDTKIVEAPLPKVPLPRELPLRLIAHRPDIISQLWLIESAGKQINVAKAGFYPDVNLNAFFGFQTIHLHELWRWPSSYFDVNPAFSLPIFDGGRLIANLRSSEVNYDTAILRYNQLVLNAAQDVLTGVAVLRNNHQQLQEYIQKLNDQKKIFELTILRVQHNLSSGLDYLVNEQNMLTAHDQEIVSLGNTIQAILSLIKALGGGYEACYLEG